MYPVEKTNPRSCKKTREIQDREIRRNVIRFRINENVIAADNVQRQQSVLFRYLQPERLRINSFTLAMSGAANPLNALLSPNIQNQFVSRQGFSANEISASTSLGVSRAAVF